MKRITKQAHLAEQFYKMPKWLFLDEFKDLSNDAKIAYMMLKDRHALSIENGWVNDHGEIYFIFTRQELAAMLGIGMTKAVSIFKSLSKFGLIDDERQGLNKPNRLYILEPDFQNVKLQTFRNRNSRLSENETQDFQNVKRNKTELNETEFSETDVNVSSLDEVPTNTKEEKVETNEQLSTIIHDLQSLNIPTVAKTVEIVREWTEQHSIELIQAVIEKCVRTAKNGVNLNYLDKAIQNLKIKGIETLEQLEQAEQSRKRATRSNSNQRVEVMPTWEKPTPVESTPESEHELAMTKWLMGLGAHPDTGEMNANPLL